MWAKIIFQCSTSSHVGLPICIHTSHMHKRLFQSLHFSWLHSKLWSDVLPFHSIKGQENCNPVHNFHSMNHILVISTNTCMMKRSYHLQWWWYWQGTVMLHHLICLLFVKMSSYEHLSWGFTKYPLLGGRNLQRVQMEITFFLKFDSYPWQGLIRNQYHWSIVLPCFAHFHHQYTSDVQNSASVCILMKQIHTQPALTAR